MIRSKREIPTCYALPPGSPDRWIAARVEYRDHDNLSRLYEIENRIGKMSGTSTPYSLVLDRMALRFRSGAPDCPIDFRDETQAQS
jgi:hypothetical protein